MSSIIHYSVLPALMTLCTLLIVLLTDVVQGVKAQEASKPPMDSSDFHILSVSLLSQEIKRTAIWYKKFLHFKMATYRRGEYVKLTLHGFDLNVMQGKNVRLPSDVTLPKGKTNINRITKIGFACRDFMDIYEHLKLESQTITQGLTMDQNLGMNYFIALDPDETPVQIFESEADTSIRLKPIFFAITTSDYIHTLKWYKDYLHFAEVNIEDDSKTHFQDLLNRNGVIFEIIYLPYVSAEITEFMPEGFELSGIEQITFQSGEGKTAAFKTDNHANKVTWLR